MLEDLFQRPVKGLFNGPVKQSRTFIYGTPQRHKIPLKLMFRISVVSLKLTRMIQKISYHNILSYVHLIPLFSATEHPLIMNTIPDN